MAYSEAFLETPPTREAVDAQHGPLVVEFGTPWCGHCKAAMPHVAAAFANYPQVAHLRIEDGPGQRLGRSFGVKLWPTLVFLRDGVEVARLVRPTDTDAIDEALARIA
ncbi:MAG TPA: thioredoxin family protein [Azospira sp.]|nr:thioredoxin family protein [Azospira sp.]